MRKVFPHRILQKAKHDYGRLGKATNELRDIDVYLLEADYFRSLLPERMRPALSPFFEKLSKSRSIEQKKIARMLRSKEYQRTIRFWRKYFALPPAERPEAAGAKEPIAVPAGKAIAKRYRRVIKDGRAIDDRSPDEWLHQLRIDCKKLRYLLEFFQSLYDPQVMQELIRHLKGLQDNLGQFNDLYVQQQKLQAYVEENSPPSHTVLAIGYLTGILGEKQKSVRQRFYRAFAQFDDAETAELFSKILDEK